MKLIISLLLSFTFVIFALDPELIVPTRDGPVKGILKQGYRHFLGIPYAAPPVAENRFRAPQPIERWSPNIYSATKPKPSCPQQCGPPTNPILICPKTIDEDCLYLNVYTPVNVKKGSLPVMVFIFGGAFVVGTADTPLYSANAIVNTNTILVSFEYRLGALGYMMNDKVDGNYGIQDQRAVLTWVQQNIANFGGDPTRITLFGESAGAMSTAFHMASPLSAGLFQQVIIESDPFAIEYPLAKEAKETGAKFTKILGCSPNDMDCLRAAPWQDVLNASLSTFVIPNPFTFSWAALLPWLPVAGGKELPEQPLRMFAKGQYNKVPVIVGTNNNEGVWFVYMIAETLHLPVENLDYAAVLLGLFKSKVAKVVEEYPPPLDPFTDLRPLLSRVVTDYGFSCASRHFSVIVNSTSRYPVYLYHFDYTNPVAGRKFWPKSLDFCWDKVCHGTELVFVFDSAIECGLSPSKAERWLAEQVVTYWTNFAHTGNPNQGKPVSFVWPAFTTETRMNVKFDLPKITSEKWLDNYCNFWDDLGYFF